MNKLTLASHETNVTMSSREIAKLTGKRISAVHSDIRAMVPALYASDNGNKIRSYAWGTTKDEMISFLNHNKIQGIAIKFDDRGYVHEFLLDRRHTEILVTGYDINRRAAVIDRWYDLESGQARPAIDPMTALNDPEFLRSTLLTYSEKVIALEHTNKNLSNKVECMSNLFKEGMTTTQFCKMLNGVNTQLVNVYLCECKWVYNESRSGKNTRWRAASYARDRYLTEIQDEISPHGHDSFIKFQPVLLKKGAKRLYDLYLAGELPMKKNWNGLFTHDKEFKGAA